LSDHDELIRIRDRFHEFSTETTRQLLALDWRAGDHERALGSFRDELRALQAVVDGMTHAEEIAAAVTTALRSDRRRWFNGWRRLGTVLASLVLLVPAVHDLVGWLP